MKKTFKLYVIAWAVMLALFNVVVFSVRALPGFKIVYDLRFWISWTVVILSYAGQLLCAREAFSAETKDRFFLSLPLITVSYGAAVVTTVIASVIMLIPACPAWIAAVVCALTAGFAALSVIKSKAALEILGESIDSLHKAIFDLKVTVAEYDALMRTARSDTVKEECKKVYETARYSDPVSVDALCYIEEQIAAKNEEFKAAVEADDAERAREIANEIRDLFGERNSKCKALK